MTTAPSASFARLTDRLSAVSVRHRAEAYRDVAWDAPASAIDGADPCWQLPSSDPIGASIWYRDQSAEARSRIGLQRVVALLKIGIEFEAVLQQGLLDFAAGLPNNHPAFRYVYHEITEEAQHSMMFQEFVNRSGVDIAHPSDDLRRLYRSVSDDTGAGWTLTFLSALTAESVFDQLQRELLGSETGNPLFRRISEIHIAEEARHLTFARAFLAETFPALTPERSRFARHRAPFVVDWVTRHVLDPEIVTDRLVTDWGAPPDVVADVIGGEVARARREVCAAGVVDFCDDLGLIDTRAAPRLGALRWLSRTGPAAGSR